MKYIYILIIMLSFLFNFESYSQTHTTFSLSQNSIYTMGFSTFYYSCKPFKPPFSYNFSKSNDTLYVKAYWELRGISQTYFCTEYDSCLIAHSLSGINYITGISNFAVSNFNTPNHFDTVYHTADSTFALRTTGLNNLNHLEKEVKLWPNPVSNTLSISAKYLGRIKIYNVLGMLVKEAVKPDVQGKMEVDVSNFSSGIYFVRFEGKKMQEGKTMRFRKE